MCFSRPWRIFEMCFSCPWQILPWLMVILLEQVLLQSSNSSHVRKMLRLHPLCIDHSKNMLFTMQTMLFLVLNFRLPMFPPRKPLLLLNWVIGLNQLKPWVQLPNLLLLGLKT
uniref:Uncharacterized protein n=1 Tax=Cacopsylla melanoneura TaxID=428564 RepID=A0A8D8XGH0_9HEMI